MIAVFSALAINAQAFNSDIDNEGYVNNHACNCDVLGHAFNLKTKELEYLEYHFVNDEGQSRRVEYRSPSGDLIVNKQLNYANNKVIPEFEQVDLRTGKILSAKYNGSKIMLRYAKPKNSNNVLGGQLTNIRQAAIPVAEWLVVDAGFDHFIRNYWEVLANGKPLQFDFAVPVRATTIKMLIEELPSSDCENLKSISSSRSMTKPTTCFKLRAKSWLINMLLKPIYLSYDSHSRELIHFKGLGNINSTSNKNARVLIRYHYRS